MYFFCVIIYSSYLLIYIKGKNIMKMANATIWEAYLRKDSFDDMAVKLKIYYNDGFGIFINLSIEYSHKKYFFDESHPKFILPQEHLKKLMEYTGGNFYLDLKGKFSKQFYLRKVTFRTAF